VTSTLLATGALKDSNFATFAPRHIAGCGRQLKRPVLESEHRINLRVVVLAWMPLYRFALEGHDPPLHDAPEWLADDVAALRWAAMCAAELSQHREDAPQFVLVYKAGARSSK
jgi:hypothetical protein